MATKMKSVLGKRARPSKQPEDLVPVASGSESEEDASEASSDSENSSNPISGESDSDSSSDEDESEEEDEELPDNLPSYQEATKKPFYEVGDNELACVLCGNKKFQNKDTARREHLGAKLHKRRIQRFEEGLSNTPTDELPEDPRAFAAYVDELAKQDIEHKQAQRAGETKAATRTPAQQHKTQLWSLNRKMVKAMKQMKKLEGGDDAAAKKTAQAEVAKIAGSLEALQAESGVKQKKPRHRAGANKKDSAAQKKTEVPSTLPKNVPGLPARPTFDFAYTPANQTRMSEQTKRPQSKDKSAAPAKKADSEQPKEKKPKLSKRQKAKLAAAAAQGGDVKKDAVEEKSEEHAAKEPEPDPKAPSASTEKPKKDKKKRASEGEASIVEGKVAEEDAEEVRPAKKAKKTKVAKVVKPALKR